MPATEFVLRGEYIALDALLKAAGVVGSGGEAKHLIGSGAVAIDGQPESARARKVRAGQVVRIEELTIKVVAAF